MPAERYRLANGLSCILVPADQGHVVHAAVFFRMGSLYETPSTAGLSHFVEHLLFQGNACFRDSSELCTFVEERGGEVNAHTSPEFTEVYITLHRDFAAEGVRALAALAFGAAVDRWDVERERQIILHERAMSGPDLDAEVRAWLWPDHPLSLDVAGSSDNISGFSEAQLVEHYRRHVRPRNAVLAVAGACTADDMRAAIADAFGTVADSNGPLPGFVERDLTSGPPQRLVLDANGGGCGVLVALPVCGFGSPDAAPLQAANFLLGGGLSSRLFLRVREQAGLAYDTGTSLMHFSDRGYLVAHAGCRQEQLQACTARLLDEIRRFGEDGITDHELERMRRYMRCQMDYRSDDPVELAHWYGAIELLEHPERLRAPIDEARQIAELSHDAINAVLRRWFRADRATVVCRTEGGWWQKRALRRLMHTGMLWAQD